LDKNYFYDAKNLGYGFSIMVSLLCSDRFVCPGDHLPLDHPQQDGEQEQAR
jgi:hypothetical protein